MLLLGRYILKIAAALVYSSPSLHQTRSVWARETITRQQNLNGVMSCEDTMLVICVINLSLHLFELNLIPFDPLTLGDTCGANTLLYPVRMNCRNVQKLFCSLIKTLKVPLLFETLLLLDCVFLFFFG